MNRIAVTSIRYRYIVFEISSDKAIEFKRKDIISSLKHECMTQFQTACKTYGFFLTRFDHNRGILRCFHVEKDRAISFLQSIKKINDQSIRIETIGTSGTIKSAIRKHLDGDRLQ